MPDKDQQEQVRSGGHREHTETNLVLGGFAIILVVGGALLILTLGTGPAAFGIGIILVVFGIFLLLYKALGILEVWLRRE